MILCALNISAYIGSNNLNYTSTAQAPTASQPPSNNPTVYERTQCLFTNLQQINSHESHVCQRRFVIFFDFFIMSPASLALLQTIAWLQNDYYAFLFKLCLVFYQLHTLQRNQFCRIGQMENI